MISRRMVQALADAYAADRRGGLEYGRAGWCDPGQRYPYYQSNTVTALADKGYLWLYGGGKGTARRASITDRGKEALADARGLRP